MMKFEESIPMKQKVSKLPGLSRMLARKGLKMERKLDDVERNPLSSAELIKRVIDSCERCYMVYRSFSSSYAYIRILPEGSKKHACIKC